ncbi:MAG: benzoate-CoA ligase family protein [Nisaea sp.]|uniref:benzoate-CoA ligase family protein n=1 Tax=Nisaea sp. TaxID=2024842 RepID=UPI001B21DBD5|nr:benzoate-CoA ligase family protein [Nisaea sp.]MBO6560108.1 benzoate-CoA ligase family protein [Nisaea sp.]
MSAEAIRDLVPRDAAETAEIGFNVPERYNASSLLFDNLAQGRGDKIAVFSDLGTRTYSELAEQACRFGNGLLSLGLMRGDRVLLLMADTPAYPAAIMGAIRAGLVPILVNTLSTADLVSFYAEDAGARVLVFDEAFAEIAGAFSPELLASLTAISVNGDGPSALPGALSGADWLAAQPATLEVADTGRDDPAFMMYSSGSTGRPKGILHLQHDALYTAESYARHVLKIREDDICFSIPKIFFAYGFGNAVTFPFHAGGSVVLFSGRPTPEAVYGMIARFKPTLLFGLPTLYTAMIKDPSADGADLSSVRTCISAAEILSQEIFDAWKKRFGHEIMEGLGSTEVLHIYLSNTETEKKIGSAGKIVPGYAARLIDPEGKPVAAGEDGVLSVRGDSNAPCYWNRPDKTAETMRDGWIYTGDRFRSDADGFYFFLGRIDDLVKVSGQWVYPLEVELCLNEHPEIVECCVAAVELPDRRTILRAYVTPSKGIKPDDALTQRLKSYVRETLLPHKAPRDFLYFDELPKTGTGKIDRQTLLKRTRVEMESVKNPY